MRRGVCPEDIEFNTKEARARPYFLCVVGREFLICRPVRAARPCADAHCAGGVPSRGAVKIYAQIYLQAPAE